MLLNLLLYVYKNYDKIYLMLFIIFFYYLFISIFCLLILNERS